MAKRYGNYANVYTLSDEFGNVFYVGCTSQPMEERLVLHIYEARVDRGNKRKNEKIRSLDYKVFINSVEFIQTDWKLRYDVLRNARPAELKWMAIFHNQGCKLTNGIELQRHLKLLTPQK